MSKTYRSFPRLLLVIIVIAVIGSGASCAPPADEELDALEVGVGQLDATARDRIQLREVDSCSDAIGSLIAPVRPIQRTGARYAGHFNIYEVEKPTKSASRTFSLMVVMSRPMIAAIQNSESRCAEIGPFPSRYFVDGDAVKDGFVLLEDTDTDGFLVRFGVHVLTRVDGESRAARRHLDLRLNPYARSLADTISIENLEELTQGAI